MDIYTSNVSFENTIDSQALVKASKVRHMLTACLLTFIDITDKATKVILSAELVAGDLVIEMTIQPAVGESKPADGNARFVDWDAIQLIGEGAQFSKEQERIVLSNLA